METETKAWSLHGFEIQEGGWGMYMWEEPFEDGEPFTPFMGIFIGRIWIQDNTLIMSSWKVHDNAPNELQSNEAVTKYLSELPKWDRTKYFIKLADFGGSNLYVCATGGSRA